MRALACGGISTAGSIEIRRPAEEGPATVTPTHRLASAPSPRVLSLQFVAMLRALRSRLLRARPATAPLTFRRCLAVAASQTLARPAAATAPGLSGAMASLLEGEPKEPHVRTELPGPKVRAAKEAMGKIQDASSLDIGPLTR